MTRTALFDRASRISSTPLSHRAAATKVPSRLNATPQKRVPGAISHCSSARGGSPWPPAPRGVRRHIARPSPAATQSSCPSADTAEM